MSMFSRHLAVRMISQVLGPDWDVHITEEHCSLYHTDRVGRETLIAAKVFSNADDVITFISNVLELPE